MPLTSGEWGTDYITVSHGLRVGRRFSITYNGKIFDPSTPVAACSSMYHGIDVLVVRVAKHKHHQVVIWGDPAELKPGDELFLLPRPEIQAHNERMTFVHPNFRAWTHAGPDELPREWQNVMVGVGMSIPGFSGSPWVRNGKVYGLHKGRVRPQDTWYEVAETSTKIATCLKMVHYADLIPKP